MHHQTRRIIQVQILDFQPTWQYSEAGEICLYSCGDNIIVCEHGRHKTGFMCLCCDTPTRV